MARTVTDGRGRRHALRAADRVLSAAGAGYGPSGPAGTRLRARTQP